jgi:hypothetical protein
MRELGAQNPVQFLTIALLVGDAIAYFVFYGSAALVNAAARRRALSKRLAGCLGVVALTALFLWYTLGQLERRVDALPPEAQAAIVGRIVGAGLLPALIVVGLAAFFAWRGKRTA